MVFFFLCYNRVQWLCQYHWPISLADMACLFHSFLPSTLSPPPVHIKITLFLDHRMATIFRCTVHASFPLQRKVWRQCGGGAAPVGLCTLRPRPSRSRQHLPLSTATQPSPMKWRIIQRIFCCIFFSGPKIRVNHIVYPHLCRFWIKVANQQLNVSEKINNPIIGF